MKRRLRRRHVWIWLLLTPLIAAGIALGLMGRTPVPDQPVPPGTGITKTN